MKIFKYFPVLILLCWLIGPGSLKYFPGSQIQVVSNTVHWDYPADQPPEFNDIDAGEDDFSPISARTIGVETPMVKPVPALTMSPLIPFTTSCWQPPEFC
jgi:hypothetical protein